ncbi:kinase-like domain-containing protein [Suillus plorans]|uniref:Kinase-like domain-containing protein n=1 Tax=Suillus plorans TaxID=116603 RepID=A0A9P7AG00_9AGAM|nr:kinase-like domain-containing protein [Suillus plorans]KAG1788670.1 kinase-like domain-containing protein [Suillus plorans]
MAFNLAKIDVDDLTGMVVTTDIGNRPFGSGSFADVWTGIYTTQGYSYTVAVKILRSSLLSNNRIADKTIRVCKSFIHRSSFLLVCLQKILREAKIWSTLDHPNVARFIGVYYEQHTQRYRIPRLVSTFYRNRTLKDRLVHIHNNHERWQLFRQFLSGLEYLHRNKVIHGDLKPTNVLIDDSWNAVLTDFGLSLVLEAHGFTTTTVNSVGTLRYMAPELMNPANTSASALLPTVQSDIWSAGMTGLEILSGIVPYPDQIEDTELIVCISGGEIPSRNSHPRVSRTTWSALETCWEKGGKRPAVSTLIRYLDANYPSLQLYNTDLTNNAIVLVSYQ